MNKVNFVTVLHGDEIVPMTTLAQMNIPQYIGNPKAVVKRKRYLETDLNSSFGKSVVNYETKRAAELLSLIPPQVPVVDLHTFTNPSPPFVIIVDMKLLPLARRTGIPRVVYMKHNIKSGCALINHRAGISVEVGQNNSMKSYQQTQKLVHALKSAREHKVDLYEVYGTIEKYGKFQNFVPHRRGFIPILAGRSSYDHFGLKSRKIGESL